MVTYVLYILYIRKIFWNSYQTYEGTQRHKYTDIIIIWTIVTSSLSLVYTEYHDDNLPKNPATMPIVVGRLAAHTPSRFRVRSSMLDATTSGGAHCEHATLAYSLQLMNQNETKRHSKINKLLSFIYVKTCIRNLFMLIMFFIYYSIFSVLGLDIKSQRLNRALW